MVDTDTYLLVCKSARVGLNESFWKKGERGYTSNIDDAQTYTYKEIMEKLRYLREEDIPILKSYVEDKAVFKGNHQLLPRESIIDDNKELYVCYGEGGYLGNDVYWVCQLGRTLSFEIASIIHRDLVLMNIENSRGFIFIPLDLAQSLVYRAAEYSLLHDTLSYDKFYIERGVSFEQISPRL